jgi:hypothetical protein
MQIQTKQATTFFLLRQMLVALSFFCSRRPLPRGYTWFGIVIVYWLLLLAIAHLFS